MTPVYDLQNPPPPSDFNPVDQHKDDQFLQLFLSSTAAASSSSSSSVSFPTNFFDASQDNYQRIIKVDQDQFHHVPHDHHQKDVHGGSNYDAIQEFSSSSSLHENPASGRSSGLKLYLSKKEVGEGSRSEQGSPYPSSGKWISSKVKPSCIAGDDQSAKINEINSRSSSSNSSSSSTNNSVRVCSDCNTTTTPLWRSGPRGPKSLCNACGIRQRKARKAMEAAAAAAVAGSPSIKIKVLNNKEKKSRSNQRKLCFKDFALSLSKNSALKQVLPQDVEEAAILLMELSCGFIQS